MRPFPLLLLAALLGTGCLADRVVTLHPATPPMIPVTGTPRPLVVLPFADRRGAIAESPGINAVGGLYGLGGAPAAMLVSEPYPVTLQKLLISTLNARGIAAGAGPTPGANVLSGTVVDFYGYLNWGAGATLRAYVRITGPDGTYLADKTVSIDTTRWGIDTCVPKLEVVLGKVMTSWVEAVAFDADLTQAMLVEAPTTK